MRCREAVRVEFARRRAANPRYSLRRFALALGVSHATLSRLLRGGRPVPPRSVRVIARGLGLAPDVVERMVTAEVTAAVAAAIARPAFRPASRDLAITTGLSVDTINIALHALLRDGMLRMPAPDTWIVTPGAL